MAKKVSDKMWRSVNRNGAVKKALIKRAEVVRARAESISRQAGGTANYTIRSGIRPGGRVYVDVVSDNPDEEFGTEEVQRTNALRRAVRGG